jgi:hypothetical protein
MADALDSKSSGGNSVWVQVPPPVPKILTNFRQKTSKRMSFCLFVPKNIILGLKNVFSQNSPTIWGLMAKYVDNLLSG